MTTRWRIDPTTWPALLAAIQVQTARPSCVASVGSRSTSMAHPFHPPNRGGRRAPTSTSLRAIRGRFDPVGWAADPDRRPDLFDPHAPVAAPDADADGEIRGHPGSAGQVEGLVRRIDRPDEGDQLQAGEILVAGTTNVGWTPLFPRLAAVVTDVGGSLSHAAIVARELGIPAVVGCVDATTRLRTGDRIRVDGGQGIVEILATAKADQ